VEAATSRLISALSRPMVASAASIRGEHLAHHEGVVGSEAADQGLLEQRNLDAQTTLGQLGQDLGVADAGDQGGQHRPAGDTQDVAGHARQLDAGVRQQPAPAAPASRVRSSMTVLR
jgi:hypothetical protein